MSYASDEEERIILEAAKDRLKHVYVGKPPPASDYWASLLYYGTPVEQYGYDDPIIKQQKYPPIWETPYGREPPDPKQQFIPIEQPLNQGTRQPFNPYDVGAASYLRNVWQKAMERAKQENTTPKIYTYGQPSPTGGNTGGGILGWFSGIPGWIGDIPERARALREQNKKDWEEWQAALEERDRIHTNINSQEVISDNDINDPLINIEGGLDIPSAAPDRSIWDTWDDFVRGVKEGWDAGGLTDYKTPLMIAGGVLVLILLIK